MPSPRTKPSLTSLVAFGMLLAVVYVLSYAPVVRVCEGPDPDPVWISPDPLPDEYPLYKPVDWLIDNTPLRKPLFFWADTWGVRIAFENARIYRIPFLFNSAKSDSDAPPTPDHHV